MLRDLLVVLISAVFIFGAGKLSFAQDEHSEHKHGTKAAAASAVSGENAGNKICPVSGDKIDEKLKVIYEYQGRIYNFCCPVCVEDFKKDPEKYIKKVEEELQTESKGEATREGHEMGSMQEAGTAHQGMHH